jgi:predicted nucleic acid-binding protein
MSDTKETISITVPEVDGQAAAEATDLMADLVERYKISGVDADALFNACVAIYVRGRVVTGDRAPTPHCSTAGDGSDMGN